MNIKLYTVKLGGRDTLVHVSRLETLNPDAVTTWEFDIAEISVSHEIAMARAIAREGLVADNGQYDELAVLTVKGQTLMPLVMELWAKKQGGNIMTFTGLTAARADIPAVVIAEFAREALAGTAPTQDELDALKLPTPPSTSDTAIEG